MNETPEPQAPTPAPATAPESAAVPSPVKARKTTSRALLPGMLAVPVLLCAVGISAWWAVATEPGTRQLLNLVPGLAVEEVQGSLAGEFSAQRVRYTLPGGSDQIELQGLRWQGLQLAWNRSPALWADISLDRLHADRLTLTLAPSTEPTPAPSSLLSPLGLHVRELSIDSVHSPELGDQPLRDVRASVDLGAAQGQQHQLTLHHLAWDLMQATGKLNLGSQGTLPLDAQLQLQAAASEDGLPAWSAQVQAKGPLQSFQLQGQLAAQAQHLQAQAQVQPFAAWPLQSLQLDAKALDLAALLSGAPRTALTGSATLRAQAAGDAKAGQTLAVQAQLSNAAAGTWNQALLPLRSLRLDLSCQADDPAALQIKTLDLALGSAGQPAGRLNLVGSSSAAQGVKLAIALEQLRGEGLDTRLQGLQANGRIELSTRQAIHQLQQSGADPQLQVKAQLNGQWLARKPMAEPNLPLNLQLQAQLSRQTISLPSFAFKVGLSELTGSGELKLKQALSLQQGWQLTSQIKGHAPDLRRFVAGLPGSAWQQKAQALDLKFDANLQAGPSHAKASPLQMAPQGTAALQVQAGNLDGSVLSGHLNYERQAAGMPKAVLDLQAGTNQVQGEASLSAAEQVQAKLNLNAGQLKAMQALLASFWPGARLSGSLQGDVSLQLQPEALSANAKSAKASAPAWAWRSEADLRASGLQLQNIPGPQNDAAGLTELGGGQLQWALSSGLTQPQSAQLSLQNFASQGVALPQAKLQLKGTWAQHSLLLDGSVASKVPAALIPPDLPKNLIARGPIKLELHAGLDAGPLKLWREGGRWQFSGGKLLARPQDNALAPWLQAQNLSGQISLAALGQLKQAELKPGRLDLLGAGLRWKQMSWAGEQQIALDLNIEPLAVAPLLARWQPDFGWGGDLVVAGYARISSQPKLQVDIALERSSGDLSVTDDNGTQMLQLTDLRVGLVGSPGLWHLTQAAASVPGGALAGALTARNADGQLWPGPNSQLQGVLEAQVTNLNTWGALLPAGWRVGGSFLASASFGGRLGAPEITGLASAEKLSLRNPLLGVDVNEGELRLTLSGGKAQLETFKLRAGGGELSAAGLMQLGAKPHAELQVKANKFALLRRVDRRLSVNGQLQMLTDPKSFDLSGQLDVEEGLFDFSRNNAPELDDDVQVRRPTKFATHIADKAASKRSVKVKLDIDLGQKLRVRGHGLDTLLAGKLVLTQAASGPALNGQIKAVKGSFDAYGQKLTVEKGLITFTGAPDNPRLDVLALRPNKLNSSANDAVQVGVTVTGTAQSPRIKLYSDPEMADSAKLSWLLLGRAPDQVEGNDAAMLQSAALALLAGDGEGVTTKVMKTVGLDELSFDGKGSDFKGTVVRVGKNLSERWYVGYERGLNATTGVWQLIYRAAQRFTLRAQSGDENALDLIWQWKWE